MDPASQTSVRVVEQTADGFRVVIYAGVPGPLFADGFETGGVGRWSDSTPSEERPRIAPGPSVIRW
ncbi:MAG: hypothetical protein R2862_03685 [Thermoanaerobaculia bacterium]